MAPKTIKKLIADTLEDLGSQNLEKFVSQLLDRREEPRVPRSKVEGKGFLVITDKLVSVFCERGALQVTLETLRDIGCNQEADGLASAAETNGHVSKAPCSDESAAEANRHVSKAVCSDGQHFVDKYMTELIQRLTNLDSILDVLFSKKVIQGETYDKIRAVPVRQDKIRELYRTALQGGTRCKDIFYQILEEQQPYLIQDLKEGK